MDDAVSKTRSLDRERLFARLLFCGCAFLMFTVGCHMVSKTPSRDLYNFKFMSKEWKAIVREIVAGPERQANIIEASRITGEEFKKLEIESQEIKRDYLKIMASYDCDVNDFEPLMERILKAEETSSRIILDLLDVVRENTTTEELKLLIKRKLEP